MNRRGEIQRKGAIAGYVLPLAVGVVSLGDAHPLRVESVEGAGFLIAEGRGLAVTAKHVVKALLAMAPIPDLSVPISKDLEGYPDEVRHDYFTEGQKLLNGSTHLFRRPHPTSSYR